MVVIKVFYLIWNMSNEKESLVLIQTISTCLFKQKINQEIQSRSQSVRYWNSSSPPAACAAQLNMIYIYDTAKYYWYMTETIFIKMWMIF